MHLKCTDKPKYKGVADKCLISSKAPKVNKSNKFTIVVSYGVSVESTLEKIVHVITGTHFI